MEVKIDKHLIGIYDFWNGHPGDEWDGNACTMPTNTLHISAEGSVLYNSSTDIGGFQFIVDGTTVTDASGGDTVSAGFSFAIGGLERL